MKIFLVFFAALAGLRCALRATCRTQRVAIVLLAMVMLFCVPLASPDLFTDSLMEAEHAWGYSLGARVVLSELDTSLSCLSGSIAMRALWPNVIAVNPHCKWIAAEPQRKVLVRDFMHEIGHLLGVPHSLDYESLMYFVENGQPATITRQDRDKAAWVQSHGGTALVWSGL